MTTNLVSRLVNPTVRRSVLQGRTVFGFINEGCSGKFAVFHANFSASSKGNGKESPKEPDDELDKPIPFSTSKASRVSAYDNLSGDPFPDSPWYQPFVVSFSVGMFLIYFLALREENDFDEYMDTPLWDKVPGLEKQQLQVVLEYNRQHGLDTKDIENRLRDLEINPTSPPPRIVKDS